MSEPDEHINAVIENATLKISEKLRTELEDALTRHTKQLKEYIFERDNWLADKIKKEMQEEVGKFKDKAVTEAEAIFLNHFKSTFNVDPRDDKQRKERQKIDTWVEEKMKIEQTNQITIRRAMLNSIFGKIGAAIIGVIFFSAATFVIWYTQWGGFFPAIELPEVGK